MRGENNGFSKITKEDVIKIRKLFNGTLLSQNKIGEMFNMTGSNVSNIVLGISWGHIKEGIISREELLDRTSKLRKNTKNKGTWTKNNKLKVNGEDNAFSKLTNEIVKKIREFADIGISKNELAKLYGVTYHTIRSVVRREIWNHI